MMSRKAKEQQAATSSNSLELIKDLLNAKFSELGTRLTSLEEKLDNVTKDIHLKLNAVETTAKEASTYAQENREETEGLKFRLAELNETVSNQAITIHQLDIQVEDLKNRSLRKTLVFRNIKKQQSEKTWDDTKMVLANEISKHIQDFSKEEIIKNIERAHRVTTTNRNPSATAPPFLVAKITNWDMSEKIKSAIIKANQEGKSAVFVSQMYSKSLTERRNAALKYRADLKEQDPSIRGYVKFPVTLMIKRTGERKYSLEKEF